MQRWIVFANCQTLGLANCLSLLNPGATVAACDIWRLRNEKARWVDLAKDCDCLFVHDQILSENLIDVSHSRNHVRVPAVDFSAYHPDLCVLRSRGNTVDPPIGGYHSIIAYAAFKRGLSERDTLQLYNAQMFKALGYFDIWDAEKEQLLAHFSAHEFDMTRQFRQWTLHDSFMYSVNHPKIGCLYDIAAEASVKAGSQPVVSCYRPHDNLSNGPIFPIYDEIAEFYGIEGSYFFKKGGEYRLIDLEEFVSVSFAAYREHEPHGIWVNDSSRPRFVAAYNAFDAKDRQ